MNTPENSRGFTLIEIMIVVVILGILAAVVVPKILDRPDQARVIAAKADIAVVMQQLKLYRLDNSFYPTTDQGLQRRSDLLTGGKGGLGCVGHGVFWWLWRCRVTPVC